MPFNLHSFCFVLFFGAFITIPSLIPFITNQLSFETRYFFMFSCFVSMDKTHEIMLSMMGFMLLFQIVDHVFSAPIHFLFMDLNFYHTNPNVVEATIGFKWQITSQCVYFAFRTIVLFGVLLPKKNVFIKKNFQMKYFEAFLFIVFIVAPICRMFVYNQFIKIWIFESAQILLDFVICFENLS
jgi:hypothetical protein